MREAPLELRANQGRLVGFASDSVEGGVDVLIGHAARAKLASDAEAALFPRLRMVPRVIEGEAGVVEVALLAQAGDHLRHQVFVLAAQRKVFAHFVDRMGSAHQGAQGGVVQLRFAGELAGSGAGAHEERMGQEKEEVKEVQELEEAQDQSEEGFASCPPWRAAH